MSLGPGKYDDWLTKVREGTGASGAVLIVMDGCNGNGFSAQLSLSDHFQLPRVLRRVADEIERDFASFGSVAHHEMHMDTGSSYDD